MDQNDWTILMMAERHCEATPKLGTMLLKEGPDSLISDSEESPKLSPLAC